MEILAHAYRMGFFLPIGQVKFPCRWLFGRLPGEIVIGFNRQVAGSLWLLQFRRTTKSLGIGDGAPRCDDTWKTVG